MAIANNDTQRVAGASVARRAVSAVAVAGVTADAPVMQSGAQPAAVDSPFYEPTRSEEVRWAAATAGFIRDFLHTSLTPDFAELGHTLRERDAELCHGTNQTAQASMSHVIRAIGASGVSVGDGAHILAAYLAEERGPFSQTRMLAGLAAIGADIHGATTFDAAVKGAGADHGTREALMWVAAALRVWLDVPQSFPQASPPDAST